MLPSVRMGKNHTNLTQVFALLRYAVAASVDLSARVTVPSTADALSHSYLDVPSTCSEVAGMPPYFDYTI